MLFGFATGILYFHAIKQYYQSRTSIFAFSGRKITHIEHGEYDGAKGNEPNAN